MANNGFGPDDLRAMGDRLKTLDAQIAAFNKSVVLPSEAKAPAEETCPSQEQPQAAPLPSENGRAVPPVERPPDTAKSSTSTQSTPHPNGTASPSPEVGKAIHEALGRVKYCGYGGGRFVFHDKNGVSFVPPTSGEDKFPKPPTWICSSLEVLAKTRNANSVAWGVLLAWKDSDGVEHRWAMPLELLQRNGGEEARCELVHQGLIISPVPAVKALLSTYLQVWPTDARARCVDKLGWHGSLYVLPSSVAGNADEYVVFQNAHAIDPALSLSGTVEQWRDNVAALARGNSRMVFAICAGFAGALIEPEGTDLSGGFHLRGSSSIGKTTALDLAASVWGQYKAYCRSWRTTTNGLEGIAALHNDGLLVLDEVGEIDAKDIGAAAYMLANGKGKTRSARSGAARQIATWRLLFLSSGEQSLAPLMAQVEKRATAGQEIRLVEIDADAGVGMGAIEELHGRQKPVELVLNMQGAAAKYHGTVGREWLDLLGRDRNKLTSILADLVPQFVKEFAPTDASAQIERVARRFGLVAVGGEMATRYGLTGWPEHEATSGAGKCFQSWLDWFGSGSREERILLARARAFFELHGDSRFQNVGAEDSENEKPRPVSNRAGFYRTDAKGYRELLVFSEVFCREICSRWDASLAAKVFVGHKWIAPGSDGKTTQKLLLPGLGRTRVYVFNQKCWEGAE